MAVVEWPVGIPGLCDGESMRLLPWCQESFVTAGVWVLHCPSMQILFMLSWLKTAGRSRRAAALSSIWGTGWHVSPQWWNAWATTLQWRFQDSLVPKRLNEFLKFLTKNNCKCSTKWCEASEAVILVKSHSARLQFEVDGGLFSVSEQLFEVNWSCDLGRQIH